MKPGFGGRRKIDPDDSVNMSIGGKIGKTKKFMKNEENKQDEKVG
jgi:hypothetical protein